jgi:2-methylaconitate cis-trans-isomerase PrpF
MLPMVALISAAVPPEADVEARLFLDNTCHTAMAATGGICTAAASRIPGSIVNAFITPESLEGNVLSIKHPMGIMPVVAEAQPLTGPIGDVKFKTLSSIRTSRRILDGRLYVPNGI